MNVPRVPAGRIVRTTEKLRPRLWSIPLSQEPQFSIAFWTGRIAGVADSNGLGVPAAGKPAMHSVRLKRCDDDINRSVVEDNALYCGYPRLVSVTQHSIRNRSLELERATKDDDAMQYTRIDAQESLESLHVAVVLPKRILKPEFLPEVNGCPMRVGGVPEDPARPILQFNDKNPKLGNDEVVDLGRAAQSRNDDPSKMVIVRTAKLKWSVAKERPESIENPHAEPEALKKRDVESWRNRLVGLTHWSYAAAIIGKARSVFEQR
jgi:hypothetical protein